MGEGERDRVSRPFASGTPIFVRSGLGSLPGSPVPVLTVHTNVVVSFECGYSNFKVFMLDFRWVGGCEGEGSVDVWRSPGDR
jgi:hypothetical protein